MSWLRHSNRILTLAAMLLFMQGLVLPWAIAAAPPTKPPPTTVAPKPPPPQIFAQTSVLEKVRFSRDDNAFRLVFDMSAIPTYTVSLEDVPLQVEVDMVGTSNHSGSGLLAFNDPFVEKLQFVDRGGRLKAIITLKLPVLPKVSVMAKPDRLVIDLLKTYDQVTEEPIALGVTYKQMVRGRSEGPIRAHIIEILPKSGYTVKPFLSNDSVVGLEPLTEINQRAETLAMINGPYFMRNGEILGLLKIDGTIVTTPDISRSAFGVLPDGRFLFDMVSYKGYVELPDGSKVPIEGVNRFRGESELILYTPHFAYWTLTAGEGVEYVIKGDRIIEERDANTVIADGTVVLSASGRAAWMLQGLKVGSRVKIVQTLGPAWDKVVHAVGAGPGLVRKDEVYVTTLTEEFGSDVAGGRAPRTAVGVTKDGRLLLVVVDGRRRTSVGFSILELSQFMKELGAVEAMNLDGGGSSEMVVNGRIVNRPSDGRERPTGAAIGVIRARPGK